MVELSFICRFLPWASSNRLQKWCDDTANVMKLEGKSQQIVVIDESISNNRLSLYLYSVSMVINIKSWCGCDDARQNVIENQQSSRMKLSSSHLFDFFPSSECVHSVSINDNNNENNEMAFIKWKRHEENNTHKMKKKLFRKQLQSSASAIYSI